LPIEWVPGRRVPPAFSPARATARLSPGLILAGSPMGTLPRLVMSYFRCVRVVRRRHRGDFFKTLADKTFRSNLSPQMERGALRNLRDVYNVSKMGMTLCVYSVLASNGSSAKTLSRRSCPRTATGSKTGGWPGPIFEFLVSPFPSPFEGMPTSVAYALRTANGTKPGCDGISPSCARPRNRLAMQNHGQRLGVGA